MASTGNPLLSTASHNTSTVEQHEQVVYGIVAPCISIIGILFNAVILAILHSKRDFPGSTYVYLFDLALADLLTLFFFATNCSGRAYFPDSYDWRVYEVYFYFPFGSMVSNASIIFTVTVTVERFIFIYHPLKSKLYCTPLMAGRVTKCIWLFSIFFNLPRFFVMVPQKDGQLGFTAFGTSIAYKIIVWMYFVVTSAAPSLLLIVINWLLVLAIHRRRKHQTFLKGRNHGSAEVLQPQERNSSSQLEEGKVHVIGGDAPLEGNIGVHSDAIGVQSNCFNKINNGEDIIDMSLECSNSNKVRNTNKKNEKNPTKKDNKELMSSKQQQQVWDDFTLTLTLVVVVVVFLLGEVPSALLSRNTVVPFVGEKVLERSWYRRALMACTVLVVNQHSTNFIVYCALNNRFCAVLKKRLKLIQRHFNHT